MLAAEAAAGEQEDKNEAAGEVTRRETLQIWLQWYMFLVAAFEIPWKELKVALEGLEGDGVEW